MIVLLALLATPAPPAPVTRQTGMPEYVAQCVMVGRKGQKVSLIVEIRGLLRPGIELGGLPPRTLQTSTKASELRSLNGTKLPSVALSHIGWSKRWETSDHAEAMIGDQPVWIKLVSEDDFEKGVGIEIQERRQMTVPLYAGMCTAKPIKKSPAS